MEDSKRRGKLSRHCILIPFIAENDRSVVAVNVDIVRRVSTIVAM
jgi:hypothetical protein